MRTPAGGATTETIRSADGTHLLQRTWVPPASVPRTGSALVVHGVGEHMGRYHHVAAALNALGLTVRGWDQRGFGASGGARGVLAHPDVLLDDAREMYLTFAAGLQSAGDARPPFVIGHSMGGCVLARAVTGGWIRAPRGMVLSSPGLVPALTKLQRVAARIGSRLVPAVRIPHGLPLDKLSHDPEVERAVRADPLAHDRVTPRLVTFMLDAGEQAILDAARCRVPTLMLVAGDDHLVRPEGSRRFFANLPDGVGSYREYPELYHELFQERAADRALVLGHMQDWLRQRL